MPEPVVPVAAASSTTAPGAGPPGAPVLVLGNSLGTSAAVWGQQVAMFGRHFHVVGYELPGHGGSPAAAGPYTIGGLGAGVLALLDSLGVDRFAYCGISLGGMIGMWLASHAPDRVTALGLVCTSAYLPPADGWMARAGQVRAAGMASVSGAVIGRWFTPAFAVRTPQVIAEFQAELERTDPAGYAGCCEAIAGMDLRPDLPGVAAATLVLAGADDPATPPEHGAAIASLVPGARLEVLTDAAHLATVQAPERVTSVLLEHLIAASRSGDTGPRPG
ncbi:MAG: 3-oxoadipate enol-lactonase [Actinobacteria bacterium]|nr:3-oxoadipate enol-lactonase [Actinomycetota bacterium]